MAREHIRAFSDMPGVVLSGIFSRTREKCESLASEFAIPHVCGSIDELYEKTQAHLVVVTVSVAAMEETGLAAAQHPWALLLEKPPALSVAGVQRLVDTGADIFVAMNRRFLSSTLAVRQELEGKTAPRFIHVQDEQPILKIKQAHNHPPEVLERWMYANCIHLVDYFTFLGRGAISKVDVLQPWNGIDDTFMTLAHIAFESGDRGLYECHWRAQGPWAVSVASEDGRWEMKPLEAARKQMPGSRVWHDMPPTDDLDTDFKPGFRRQALSVIAALRGASSDALRLGDVMPTFDLIKGVYGV